MFNQMSSFPVSGEMEVYQLFETARLKVLLIERDIVEGEYEPSEYFRIIAQK